VRRWFASCGSAFRRLQAHIETIAFRRWSLHSNEPEDFAEDGLRGDEFREAMDERAEEFVLHCRDAVVVMQALTV
jgi:hypothetical protein